MTNREYMESLDENFEKALDQEYVKRVIQNNSDEQEEPEI